MKEDVEFIADNEGEYILGVAIRAPVGDKVVIVSAPRPNRHHNLFGPFAKKPKGLTEGLWSETKSLLPLNGEQGFYTNRRRFIDRKNALDVARDAGQLAGCRHLDLSTRLFSEDLW
jgi:hypothetical protein